MRLLRVPFKFVLLITTLIVASFFYRAHAEPKTTALKSAITVQLSGLNKVQEKNILSRLALVKLPIGSQADYVQHVYNLSTQEITEALQPFGYYHATVHSHLQQLNNTQWQATFAIHLGSPIYITKVDIQLAGDALYDPEFQKALQKFPLKKGGILLHQPYEQLKEQLLDLASTRGYFEATFIQHEIDVDLIDNTAEIYLILRSGPRYRFGKVAFHQGILAESFMQRFMPFAPDEFYSADKLLKLQNNLSNVYFSSAHVIPNPTAGPTPEVPVDVELTPSKSQNYTVGAGYGTDTGARGTLGWEWRRVNQYGHRLSVFAQPAQYMSNADIQYIIPGNNPLLDQYTIGAGFLKEDPPSRDLKSNTEYTSFSYRSGDSATTWQRTFGINFQHDRYQNEDTYEESNLLLPTASLKRVRGNGDFAQKPGYFLHLNVRGAAQNVLSTTSFVQGQFSGKYIYPLGTRERLLLRTDLGATANEQTLTALPPSLRFYAGGENSVRAYAYQSLGEVEFTPDGNKRILGGLYLVLGSAELEHKLTDKWSIAAFFDAGQASNSFSTPLAQGAGIGIRWSSPIGPVRLDLAQPIDDPTKRVPRINFSFGPDL